MRILPLLFVLLLVWAPAAGQPVAHGKGLVVSQEGQASQVGVQILREGGNAMDAAVATAFALAVTHPMAGNLGGGGFLLFRRADGKSEFIDFREKAPSTSHPGMFLKDGSYDEALHHFSYRAIGVPGTVRGLHMAWKRQGRLPWKRLVAPAVRLAREGFAVSATLSASLKEFRPELRKNPAPPTHFRPPGHP